MKLITRAFVVCSLALAIGCSDSDTINSITEAKISVPAEAYVITSSGFTVVDLVDPETNEPLETPKSTSSPNLAHLLHLDTDTSKTRELNEDFPNDRGIEAEYFVYTKTGDEFAGKLFLFELDTQIEFEIFDFLDSDIESRNGYICELFNSSQPDLDKLKSDAFEIKQELKIYATIAQDIECTQNLVRYEVSIEEDSDTVLKRRTYQIDSDASGDSEDEPEYILAETEINGFRATRKQIDFALPARNHQAVSEENVNAFGLLRFLESANGPDGTIEVNFFRLISDDLTELYADWSQEFSDSDAQPTTEIELSFNGTLDSSYLTFLLANDLILLDKTDLFSTSSYTARQDSLTTPIYTWSNDASESDKSKYVQLDTTTLVFFDNQVLKQVTTSGVETVLRDFGPQALDHVEIIENKSEVVVKKHSNSRAGLSYISFPGAIESTVSSLVDQLITYPFRNNFDYYLNDPGTGTNARFAQSHNGGVVELNPALIHTAWLLMKNYLENETNTLILAASESEDGILKAPNIYVFDRLETAGQGELLGSFEDNIATVEEAAIINDQFGMIWVKDTFEADAPIKAYHFNPTQSPWQFTLIESDTGLPNWLPAIEP